MESISKYMDITNYPFSQTSRITIILLSIYISNFYYTTIYLFNVYYTNLNSVISF